MEIDIGGVSRGFAKGFTNEANSHKAFTTNALVIPSTGTSALKAGTYTLTLRSSGDTVTDANDSFNVTVLELPI